MQLENEDGETVWVRGAAAELDEKEVGWCLKFSDEPGSISVLTQVPSSRSMHALAAEWLEIGKRIAERGVWSRSQVSGSGTTIEGE